MSIKEIKDLAKKEIPNMLRGAAPTSSLASARKLGQAAIAAEESGNVKDAFRGYQRVTQ